MILPKQVSLVVIKITLDSLNVFLSDNLEPLMDTPHSVFAANKTLNIVMLWLFCVTVALLVLPLESISPELALQVEAHKTYLFLALIVEVSNFISQAIIGFLSSYFTKRSIKQEQEAMKQVVAGLDFAERALLREFVLQRKSVLYLPEGEPTVRSLVDSGILNVIADADPETGRVPVVITKKARPFITYRAIGLTRGKMDDEMLEKIMNSRPEFAREKKVMPRAYRGVKAAWTQASFLIREQGASTNKNGDQGNK